MENSGKNSDVLVIPKKPRSLDVHSLYVEKSRGLEEGGGSGFKRKRRSLGDDEELGELGSGQGEKRRKRSRKEVSLSSFESVNKKSRSSSSNVEDKKKLSQFVLERKDSGGKKSTDQDEGDDGNLQKMGSVNISASLDNNVVPIPKRPRCFSRTRRKQFQINHIANEEGRSSKISPDAQVVKLNDHSVAPVSSSEGKRENVLGEVKKSNSSKADSGHSSEVRDGASVRCKDLISKSGQRNHRKKQEYKRQGHPHEHRVDASVDDSAKPNKDLGEDDEENLEENAARMLSSRFDPSCTVFSGNGAASASQSVSMLSPGSSVHGGYGSQQENRSSGLESISDAAGRVLRPRKHGKEKRLTRKRRHFYEIHSRDVNACWVVNRKIKVLWPLDQSWYFGLVTDYDPKRKLHHVKYDDRDEEWIDLQNERFKLLLLPSEVPRKSNSDKSNLVDKKVVEKKRDMDLEDDNSGSYMDSEPIVSWLARSSRRIKSSPVGVMKRKRAHSPSKSGDPPIFSEDSVRRSQGFLIEGPDANNLSSYLELPNSSADEEMAENSVVKSALHTKVRDFRFVYVRKRFCHGGQGLQWSEIECRAIAVSNPFHLFANKVGCKAYDSACQLSGLEDLDPGCVVWSGDNLGVLKLTVSPVTLKLVKLKLCIPLDLVFRACVTENFSCMYRTLLLLQYGTVLVTSPMVQLQMLFVDNIVGLRFLLFEGCLMQAVAFVCLVLVAFNQPSGYEELVDPQVPVTSIRFDISDFWNRKRRLVFTFYNFLEVKNWKWLYLDGKLRHYCSVSKQLPLAECTYDNIKILQSESIQLPVPSACEEPVSLEGSVRRSRNGGIHMGVYKESANVNMALSAIPNEKHKKLPPFALPFSAAPTFFLSLHLKLLMAKNVASISFHNPVYFLEGPESSGEIISDECSLVESDQMNVDNEAGFPLSQDVTGRGLVSCAESKGEVQSLSISNGGDWPRSSQKCLNSGFVVAETSVSPQDSRRDDNSGNADTELQRHLRHKSGSEKCILRSWPSIPENDSPKGNPKLECFSHRNDLKVQIPSADHVESQSCDVGPQSAPQSRSDLVWNVSSPNPTAPRSIWHRNRHNSGSLSFRYRSTMWDGKEDLSQDGLANGSKKPRSQLSYLLPFGSCDYSSRPRSNHRKGRPYKKTRTESEKMVPGSSRSPKRNPELLSCDANLLITAGDKGWRECGVHVVLECVDRNDWRILVKLSGVIKYSYKAYQFLQPGATNRFTHAMMWKGGKDWVLEFPDRSQWILFKEMHEECYNRNIRAASVKSIPIPGVRLIEENDDNAGELLFFRSSPKYFRQVETEVEMALDPSRVLYDMESDDEEWILKRRTSSESSVSNYAELSEEMFERTMDMFEKVAYAQQRDNFTSEEIDELMDGIGQSHVVKDIYEYWQDKRQRKGMPLIRQFQPPLWERYQQQLKEWESAVNKIPNGGKEKSGLVQKPPMYAFCLRPRGLEVPSRGSKQRSHRKLSSGCHSYSFARDSDGNHSFGRRSTGFTCGEERFAGTSNHDSLYASWHTSTRVISPRDGTGYLSMSSDGSERSQQPRPHRSKSKKMKTVISSNDSQMMSTSYSQRSTNKRNGNSGWNVGLPEWPSRKQYHPEGLHRQRVEKLGGPEFDEFRLRDASGAAQHASNMAKLKREKAQRLLYRADLAIHKAMVALMTAEAIKASSEEPSDDR